MATAVVVSKKPKEQHTGLTYWMHRAVKEAGRVRADFSPDPVHDLRVALRRCRSMADVLAEVAPIPYWQAIKKASRKLFRRLGELRDTQVRIEWVQGLAPESDPLRGQLLAILSEQEERHKEAASAALTRFDIRKWEALAALLRKHASAMRPDGRVAQAVALERFEQAQTLHQQAIHHRSREAWHALRIGVKRFRYTVENFLPSRHAEWSEDLKRVQDLLGEVHDLDELSRFLGDLRPAVKPEERERWRNLIQIARTKRLAEYRAMTGPKKNLWTLWRAGLPEGRRIESAAMARLITTASVLDPDFLATREETDSAIAFLDSLAGAEVAPIFRDPAARRIFHAAALLRNIARGSGQKSHHKAAQKTLRALAPPPGWTSDEMNQLALVVRYHRGAGPKETHADFQALPPDQRERILWLAGTLRLALALKNGARNGAARTRVEKSDAGITIYVRGVQQSAKQVGRLLRRKSLLEWAARQPVLIEPDSNGYAGIVSGRVSREWPGESSEDTPTAAFRPLGSRSPIRGRPRRIFSVL
ncbi:MAG TPA: CHAD domain-containing protein [Candidatus Acidoferrales bacterium]|nr:CHAD domain-containing protein [Candidatus Acidoferrales bacterium]